MTGLAGRLVMLAVCVGLGAPVAEASTSRCALSLAVVQARLNEEPKMRDEAYTAIMLQQLAAEEAARRGDEAGCLDALDVARLVLGIAPAPRHQIAP